MLHSLDYREADIAAKLASLMQGQERLTVYFGLYDEKPDSADHIADFLFRRNTYYLHVQGHGIAAKTFSYEALAELIQELLRFNRLFNLTERLYVESED